METAETKDTSTSFRTGRSQFPRLHAPCLPRPYSKPPVQSAWSRPDSPPDQIPVIITKQGMQPIRVCDLQTHILYQIHVESNGYQMDMIYNPIDHNVHACTTPYSCGDPKSSQIHRATSEVVPSGKNTDVIFIGRNHDQCIHVYSYSQYSHSYDLQGSKEQLLCACRRKTYALNCCNMYAYAIRMYSC